MSTNNSAGNHGALVITSIMQGSGAHTGPAIGSIQNSFIYNASGTTANAASQRNRLDITNSGVLTNGYGYLSEIVQTNGTNISYHHFYAAASALDIGGARTNEYGVYVESLTKATNNWGLWTAGTMGSSLGGFLDLRGRTAPALSNPAEFRMYMDSGAGRPKASFNGGAFGFIPVFLSGTSTLDFPSTAAGGSQDLTISVTGAALGQMVWLGVPNGSVNANCVFFAWVSATNTVTVRHLNNSGGAVDPASGSFTVAVLP